MEYLPPEIWLEIINYLPLEPQIQTNTDPKYNLYFTCKRLFELIDFYDSTDNIFLEAMKRGELGIIRYINKLHHQEDPLVLKNTFKIIPLDSSLIMACKSGHLNLVKYFVKGS